MKQLFRKKNIHHILQSVNSESTHALHKNLGVKDLTALGIAAIIGAGIFTTIGKASADGGPGVVLLFIFTAIACGFSAFAYAEFASTLPVSGSAYTYSYVSFGELFAWIIGWALIMEYAIGNITVAIGWSGYFTALLHSVGWDIPAWLATDYFSARNGFEEVSKLFQSHQNSTQIQFALTKSYEAWLHAPSFLGLKIIFDLPALFIVVVITYLVYRGIEESKDASNWMVGIKLIIILLVIVFGVFYINSDNWVPFLPNGMGGVLQGVSAVFFAYIGFDAISTTAEECKNPQRDLPRGMMYAIIICTILYCLIALVLTGMVNYKLLNVDDPLAFVFEHHNLKWLSGIVSVSAIVAMASVLLVFQLGQPRIWMSMSRDGLLPPAFSKIHPKFKTPSFSTIVTGLIVGIGTLVFNLSTVTDLTSIGTLFAFVLVCAGVLKLHQMPDAPERKFKTPYINSRWILPLLFILCIIFSFLYNPLSSKNFIFSRDVVQNKSKIIQILSENPNSQDALFKVLSQKDIKMNPTNWQADIMMANNAALKNALLNISNDTEIFLESNFSVFSHNIPLWLFWLIFLYYSIQCIIKKHSLIPVLGLLSCFYMMSQIELKNWIGFLIWLAIGLVIFFSYSIHNSNLKNTKK